MAGGPESRLEAQETLSVPERVWLEHSLIRHERGDLHPCVAPHRMQNMEGKWVEAGKSLYDNQCAIRMGDALKRAGVVFPPHILRQMLTCGAHPPGELHTLRAPELARGLAILSETRSLPGFKPVQKLRGEAIKAFFSRIPSKPGIIYIQGYWRSIGEQGLNGGHIDMYNGYRTTAKSLNHTFNVVGCLPNYQHAQEVWFFEIEDDIVQRLLRRRADTTRERTRFAHGGAEVAAAMGALSVSLRSHLGRTIGGTFDDAEGADNRELVMGRRAALGVGALIALSAPFVSTPAKAQQRQRERVARGTEQTRDSIYAPRIAAYEGMVQQNEQVLKTGSIQEVQRLLFSRPEIAPFELLPELEQRRLHPRIHKGYITEEQERSTGLMSLPLIPSKITPPSFFDARRGLPDLSEVARNPLAALYDGSTWYSNGIRVGSDTRLLEGMYAYSVSGRNDSLLRDMQSGQQSFSVRRDIPGIFGRAGVISFDENISRAAKNTWTNVVWLKNPDVSENNGDADSRSLEWDGQKGGGFLFDLKDNTALREYVKQVVLSYAERGGSAMHQFQKELVTGVLPSARLLVLSSSDVHYYETTMQQVSGAAIVKNNASGKPVLIGQALWRIHLPKPDGSHQVALIVTDTDQTKRAFERSM